MHATKPLLKVSGGVNIKVRRGLWRAEYVSTAVSNKLQA
jgi:hypothetical protein